MVVIVITLAYVLPSIYTTLFDTRIDRPYITYSETTKEYFIQKSLHGKPGFVDRKNKVYDQYQFMDANPINNFYYHLSKGTLPDSFAGVKLVPQLMQKEMLYIYAEPHILNAPVYGLYPLFESRPEFGLSYPKDMFRITHRIEFIDAKSNVINEEKSKQFSAALDKEGFAYPAKLVAGLPTLMKRKDEGWFITDSKEQFFHLVMIKGQPYVKKIALPEGVTLKYIIAHDSEADEFFAVLIAKNNSVHVLNKRDYSTTQFPINGYTPENTTMLISGNMFTKTIALQEETGTRLFTVDRQYKLLDQYALPLAQKSTMSVGKVFSFLFPFHLALSSSYSQFIRFTPVDSNAFGWIILNVIFLVITVWLIRREGRSLSRSIPDLIIVALTGIFGFLAVHIVPNKQY